MRQKERPYLLLIYVLLFVLVAVFYLLYYLPLSEKREQAEYRLAQLTTAIDRAEQKRVSKPTESSEAQLAKLSEALPVKPYTHQLILDLDKLKTLSAVSLENVTFDEEKKQSLRAFVEELQLSRKEAGIGQKEDAGEPSEATTGNQPAADQSASQSSSDTQDLAAKLAALPDTQLTSIGMTLRLRGDYQQLYQFITEVQELSRYLRVDQIIFDSSDDTDGNGNTTAQTAVQPATAQPTATATSQPTVTEATTGTPQASGAQLTVTLKLTSYYVPQYATLIKKLPPILLEKPSNKQNPTEFGNS
ncbi:hypothetical protein [Brevibacillus dissolubilis]|uniref:hypothetical protein n=1 Tax=Brevibacillus dissolubilis TaxID=1844116 RepID=UPI0011179501|nr:hypothetical protein [Brevibacillus dissolubilis]